MNKSSIRAFGIACFLIGAVYLLFDINDTKTIASSEYEDKINTLEQQLKSANEQIKLLKEEKKSNETADSKDSTESGTSNKSEQPEPDSSTSNDDSTENESSNEIVKATLHIYSGLTAYDIGKKLEDLGIVKNGLEMELYLAKPEFAKSIQIGQFELDSSMTIEEIANLITGK
ncbi:hypothetical protein ACOQFO_15725 [Ureibacillus sp. MALMAid1270]|uniref:hypothetical protein n=1 Tax=Ureibacillus sp. MALMAid1270 TaxID=3411629 RepID=UPI003BA6EE0F